MINSAVIIFDTRNTIENVSVSQNRYRHSGSAQLPSSTGGIRLGMSAFDPAPDKDLPSPLCRCAATALGHHMAVRPEARAACHSSDTLGQPVRISRGSAKSFHTTSESCEDILYVLPLLPGFFPYNWFQR
jgi:hypothetical protein